MLVVWSYFSELNEHDHHVDILTRAALVRELKGIPQAAGDAVNNDDWPAVVKLAGYSGAYSNTEAALITDSTGRILASAPPSYAGRDVSTLSPALGIAIGAEQLRRVAGEAGPPLIWFSPDRRIVTGLVALEGPPGTTHRILAIIRNLSAARQQTEALAGHRAFQFAAVVGLYLIAIAVLFHFTVNRRVAHLVDVARRYAGGDRSVRTGMAGSDEFACIGMAMDRMADASNTRLDEMQIGEQLLRMQIEVLESVANGNPIEDIMTRLCELVQRELGRGWCAVSLLNDAGSALLTLAAPSFPSKLTAKIDELSLDGTACGTAMREGKPVISEDAMTDPRWSKYRDLINAYGIRAVWSQPFVSDENEVVGTVTLLFDTPGTPTSLQQQLLLAAGHLAGNAWRSHQARSTLQESEARYRSVVSAVGEGVTVCDEAGDVVTCNDAGRAILGYKRDVGENRWRLPPGHRWVREDGTDFPADLYPPTWVMRTGKPKREAVIGFELPGQDPRWLSISSQPLLRPGASAPHAVVSSFSDITLRRVAEKRLAVRTRLLEITALDLPMIETLDRINLYIESCTRGTRCSVLLVDESGEHLRHGSAPSLPGDYNALVDGLPIGPKSGACGTAAYRDTPVIVSDTQSDPLWESYRDIALKYNLPACWSTPIHGDDNKVIGTFAVYFDHPHTPTVEEVSVVENATNIVALVLQREASKSALAASELLYQSLVQVMAEGLVVVDRERRVQKSNPAAERMLNVPMAEMPGRPPGGEHAVYVGEDGRPLDPPKYPSNITLRTGKSLTNVVVGFQRDPDTVTWLSINSQPLRSALSPTPTGALLTINDITEKKLAEQKLRQSEERLRASIENTPNVAVQWYDQDGHVVFWNHASEILFGWTTPEAVGKTREQLMLTAGQSGTFAAQLRQLSDRGGSHGPAEHGFRHRDGSEGICLSTLYTIPSGGEQLYFACMDVDITKRKQAEQALQESEQRWQFALEGSGEGVWDWDIASGRVYSSKRLIEMLGYDEDEWVHTLDHWDALLHPDDREMVWDGINRHLQGETEAYAIEMREKCRDGGYRWFLDRGKVISRDEQGNPLRIIGTQVDITERKQAEAELRAYRDHLEEMVAQRTSELRDINAELEAFAYSISHDLRAPLRGIDGFSQALMEDYGDNLDDTGRSYIVRVRSAAQWLGRLIDSVLQLSGVTRHTMRDSKVNLSELCREVEADLRRRDPARRVAVTIAPDCIVHGDPQLLHVLLENLLGNAWKYSSKREQAHIVFGRRADGAFFVRDDGAGFDPAYADKLFVPFQRLHDARDFEGTGIGLASVQRIVRRHGGRIWADGRPDQGATFYFTLSESVRQPTLLVHRKNIV